MYPGYHRYIGPWSSLSQSMKAEKSQTPEIFPFLLRISLSFLPPFLLYLHTHLSHRTRGPDTEIGRMDLQGALDTDVAKQNKPA